MINSSRNSRSSRAAAYLAALLILLSGCALFRPEERRPILRMGTPPAEKLEKENLIAMKANAVITVRLPGREDATAARAIMYFKLPDMARIEIFGPFNGLAVVIASKGEDCSYSANGEADSCALKGMPFSGSLAPFFMGLAEAPGCDKAVLPNGTKILDCGGGTVELSDYREEGGISVPFSVKAVMTPPEDYEVSIKYSSIEFNPSELSGDTADFFAPKR